MITGAVVSRSRVDAAAVKEIIHQASGSWNGREGICCYLLH